MKKLTDEQLIEQREDLIASLEAGTNGAISERLNTLLEVERELTLRETN